MLRLECSTSQRGCRGPEGARRTTTPATAFVGRATISVFTSRETSLMNGPPMAKGCRSGGQECAEFGAHAPTRNPREGSLSTVLFSERF
jgi:hypothetical protein